MTKTRRKQFGRTGWMPGPYGLIATALFTVLALGINTRVMAATGAGQVIQNQSTVTYTDGENNDYSSQSNVATITVKQVYSSTLAEDRSVQASAGQTVYFPHTLNNTGNGQDTYTVTVAQSATDTGGDFNILKVYYDQNSNGQVDAGEPQLTGGSNTVTLLGGSQASLVIEAQLPGTAVNANTYGAKLTVTSAGNDSVDDLTAGNGTDGADETNDNLVTITGDAVLNIFKSSVHDTANNRITYTITITNTGNKNAQDVVIWDGIPANTTLVSGPSSIGFGSNTGDTAAATGTSDETVLSVDLNGDNDSTDNSETAIGLDINNDGDSSDGVVNIVWGFDKVLPANTTVSMTYTISYAPVGGAFKAGDIILNKAAVSGDFDEDGSPDGKKESNPVYDPIPQVVLLEVSDTGGAASPGVNNGADDDATNGNDSTGNDIQTVNTAPSGALVTFINTMTNNGNGTDTFELTVLNDAGSQYAADTGIALSGLGLAPGPGLNPVVFPAGTVFTFWDETGTSQLLDSNFDSTPDSGPVAAGGSVNIMVKAQLPSGVSGNGDYAATTVATSTADPAKKDSMLELLLQITPPQVDLSNNTFGDNDSGANANAYAGVGNTTAATTRNGQLGQTVTFDLTIENDAGVPDAFQLAAGSSWNGTTLGTMHAGWNITFKNSTCASGGGSTITTTSAIPASGEKTICAYVVIPANATQAVANFTSDMDGDASIETVNANGDSDGDYPIFFRVTSVNTSASDIKLDAVDVGDTEDISLRPDNSGQVQPGGSIDYPHTLKNNGNTIETIRVAGTDSASGFGNTIMVDTDGNKSPDSVLLVGATVWFWDDSAGTFTSQTAGNDSNGVPTILLEPGDYVDFNSRVFAPTSASNGTLDVLTLVATYDIGSDNDMVSRVDQTTVILGQLRLSKTAGLDAGCDGLPDAVLAVNASGAVAPGQCVVWQVVITNEGDVEVDNVILYDAAPSFTTYTAESMMSCAGDATTDIAGTGCTSGNITDANKTHTDADDAESHNDGHFAKAAGGNVTFFIGTLAAQAKGGKISSGASMTVRFTTKVD